MCYNRAHSAHASIAFALLQVRHDARQPPWLAPNVRWNMGVNLLDLAFFTLVVSLVSRETVVPLLVSRLAGSTVAIVLGGAGLLALWVWEPRLSRLMGGAKAREDKVRGDSHLVTIE